MANDNGGIIGQLNVPTVNLATGVWSIDSQYQAQKSGTWPLVYPLTTLDNSLRFNSGSSDYLSRTPASAGNRKTWTWSAWVKRSTLSNAPYLFFAYSANDDAGFFRIEFNASDTIRVRGWSTTYLETSAVYRDPSAWYHIVLVLDTTQAQASATASDSRVRLYVNGSQVTAFSSTSMPTQNSDLPVNNNIEHNISSQTARTPSSYFSGYMSEINFIDGQALDPTSFGAIYPSGIWGPKAYAGTYGTNGFYLDFSNSAALGTDYSGNGNTWTVNNLTSIDQTTDTPTNNFATLNPLIGVGGTTNVTLSEGNLKYTNTSISLRRYVPSTIPMPPNSGKYYCEGVWTTSTESSFDCFGIIEAQKAGNGTSGSATVSGIWAYERDGEGQFNGSTDAGYGDTYTTNDIIGIAYDSDSGSLEFYKNNVSQGVADTGITDTVCFFIAGFNSCVGSMEFGQTGFTYTPPSGYLALNTNNLAESL